MTRTDGHLAAGRVGKAHGLDGSFHVTGAVPGLLEKGRTVFVDGTQQEIVRRAGTDAKPIVRLSGCATREDADALRGQALMADATSAPAPDDDEYYAEQLEGCRVLDGERDVGEVTRVIGLPSCEALEVRTPDGRDLLIPLVRDAVRSVDTEQRRIDVNLAFLGAG